MVFTNYGKQAITWALGSDITNNYIRYFAIGTGSGIAAVTNTTLVTENKRTTLTESPDFTTPYKVTFQGDFNSVQMSGISLTEFGFLGSATGSAGSVWQREAFSAVAFDGTNELQVLSTLEVY